MLPPKLSHVSSLENSQYFHERVSHLSGFVISLWFIALFSLSLFLFPVYFLSCCVMLYVFYVKNLASINILISIAVPQSAVYLFLWFCWLFSKSQSLNNLDNSQFPILSIFTWNWLAVIRGKPWQKHGCILYNNIVLIIIKLYTIPTSYRCKGLYREKCTLNILQLHRILFY